MVPRIGLVKWQVKLITYSDAVTADCSDDEAAWELSEERSQSGRKRVKQIYLRDVEKSD